MTIDNESKTPGRYRATYSPDDNKLRLYSLSRLPTDVYERLKHAGFRWAPKQQLFVAPMWTPAREDLLMGLCGEIDDEDTSLIDRATERAERFEVYSEKRAEDAEAARAAVAAIAEAIPFGQPILVGHHSEKHARRDVERIGTGMQRAVKMWGTSHYWTRRAQAAIQHAKYKERPDVRQRRIRGLEADQRKQERTLKEARQFLDLWQGDFLSRERALAIANHDHIYSNFPLADFPRDPPASQYEGPMSLWSALDGGVIAELQAREIAIPAHSRTIAQSVRWLAHYSNRLAYERAMLSEAGGTAADQVKPEKGGACVCWASPRGGWSYIQKVNRVSVSVLDNWGNGGSNFTRTVPFDKLSRVMTSAEVQEKRSAGVLVESQDKTGFLLRDSTAQGVTRGQPETGPASVPSRRSFTVEQIREAEEAMAGFCLVCGAMRDTCEPDAERYTCEDCGADEVYGPHWLVMAGLIR